MPRTLSASGVRYVALALLLAATPSSGAPRPNATTLIAPRAGGHAKHDTKQRAKTETGKARLRASLENAVKADRPADVRALVSRCTKEGGDPCRLGQLLLDAIRRAKPQVAAALLAGGAAAEVRDAEGESALALAAERGNGAVVRALLRAGADPALRLPAGDTAMHRAAAYGRANVIEELEVAGADVDAQIRSDVRRDGWTPLMVAAAEMQLASVESLLRTGAHVDVRNTRGRTALMIAAWYGQKAIVERLLRAGADPAVTDALGMSAWSAAAQVGDPVILSYLRAKTPN